MRSTVHIWNMALGFIGTRSVAAQDERTPEADACNLYWDTARRAALRDYPWNFAQQREYLAELQMPDAFAAEYRHAYALPRLCLKAHKVRAQGKTGTRFVVAMDARSGTDMLLTQAERALLLYTADVTDVTRYDDLFVLALARKLATLVVSPLLKSNPAKIQELEQLYTMTIPQAREANSSEGEEAPQHDAWLTARGFYDN